MSEQRIIERHANKLRCKTCLQLRDTPYDTEDEAAMDAFLDAIQTAVKEAPREAREAIQRAAEKAPRVKLLLSGGKFRGPALHVDQDSVQAFFAEIIGEV